MITEMLVIIVVLTGVVGVYLMGEASGWWRRGKYEQKRRDTYPENLNQALAEIELLRAEKRLMKVAQDQANENLMKVHKLMGESLQKLDNDTYATAKEKEMRKQVVYRRFFKTCDRIHRYLDKVSATLRIDA